MSETTAPLLATRDALAKALCEVRENDEHAPFYATQPCRYCLGLADALLASGVVRDPATLAADEALVAVLVQDVHDELPMHSATEDAVNRGIRTALASLAAALTGDPS